MDLSYSFWEKNLNLKSKKCVKNFNKKEHKLIFAENFVSWIDLTLGAIKIKNIRD